MREVRSLLSNFVAATPLTGEVNTPLHTQGHFEWKQGTEESFPFNHFCHIYHSEEREI